MSSILKALEKVDESQRSRRPAGTGSLPKGRGRRPAWLIPAWALGGAAVATLATYAIMGGFSRPAAPVAAKGAETMATAASVAAVPVKPAPAVQEPQQTAKVVAPVQAQPIAAPAAPAKPVQPAAKVAAKALPAAAVAKQAVQPVAKPVTQAAAKAATNAAAPQLSAKAAAKQLAHPATVAVQPAGVQQPPAVAASVPVAAPPVQQKSRPEIRVTGIAWQNSSESSFAMVNGRAARQGNMVDGYKVEQIYEDSVRFSNSKGNSLVVPLGAGEE